MIGVFDSGVGGLTALSRIRVLCPSADICYFADRENLPYGTKDKATLCRLVMRDIDVLRSCGADSILMACCTASAVYPALPEEYRASVTAIIKPTAKAALLSSASGRIGYISTAFTKNSFAFENELFVLDSRVRVYGFIAAELVGMAERGEKDGCLSSEGLEYIKRLAEPIAEQRVDTLILGCTHFTYFKSTLEDLLGVRAISAADEGAGMIAKSGSADGSGRTLMINSGS